MVIRHGARVKRGPVWVHNVVGRASPHHEAWSSSLGLGQPKDWVGRRKVAPVASVEGVSPSPSVTTQAPLAASKIVARVRRHLGVMLVLIVSAALVAGLALATLIARREATAAIAAAAVVLAMSLVIVVAMLAERRSLRRDVAFDDVARRRTPSAALETPSNGKSAEWLGEPAESPQQDVRGQADLLEELLEWPQGRGA
jgi:hypothetical protein